MVHTVGSKGQVVIAKELRDQLGVEPGWLALQRIEGDHVVVYFVPPEHKKSLRGRLAGHARVRIAPGQEWKKSRDKAWEKAARDKIGAGEQQS